MNALFYVILYKGLEHLQILLSLAGVGSRKLLGSQKFYVDFQLHGGWFYVDFQLLGG